MMYSMCLCFGDIVLTHRTYYQFKIKKVQEDFTFDEEPKAILDHEIRQLRNKRVPLVKVLWQHHGMEEATWKPK